MSTNQGPIDNLNQAIAELKQKALDAALSAPMRRKLESSLHQAMDELSSLLAEIDPISTPSSVFDPSNPKVVGRFVSLALVAQPRVPLADVGRFYGSGVYAIYYNGPFPLYSPIAKTETPIYVGKASPFITGARSPRDQGEKVSARLGEHRKNIALATTSLSLADFECRSLIVQSGWEEAAESYLIHLFHPIWNAESKLVFGLGKHGDSSTTRVNKRSPWDTLHPGRKWAEDILEDQK